MRRRVRDNGIPETLATFNRDDWPAGDERDAYELWRSARRAHEDEHGWPGGSLARLMVESDVRAALRRACLLPWNRSSEELEAVAARMARLYGRRPGILVHPQPRRNSDHRIN